MNNKLKMMDWEDFVGAHGGRRTGALAGRFRRAKGMSVTPEMEGMMQAEAMRRAMAQQEQQGDIRQGLGEKGLMLNRKPLPGLSDTLGPPDAPPVGGRTSPGTTPRAKSNGAPELTPGGDGSKMVLYGNMQGTPGQSWVSGLRDKLNPKKKAATGGPRAGRIQLH